MPLLSLTQPRTAVDDFPGFIERGLPNTEEICGRRTTGPFVVILRRPPQAEDFLRFVRLRRNHAIPP